MAIITAGYGGKPFEIRLSVSEGTRRAEVWTEMAPKPFYEGQGTVEVLHYATLYELIQLRDEINGVIKEIAGV